MIRAFFISLTLLAVPLPAQTPTPMFTITHEGTASVLQPEGRRRGITHPMGQLSGADRKAEPLSDDALSSSRSSATATGPMVILHVSSEWDWTNGDRVIVSRITPTGESIDDPPLVVARHERRRLAGRPVVARGDGEFLIAWYTSDDPQPVHPPHHLWFRRIRDDGTFVEPAPVLLADVRVVSGGVRDAHPAVAWNGRDYLIAWEHAFLRAGEDGDVGIRAARLSGARIHPPQQLTSTHPSAGSDTNPKLAWDGQSYLLTWRRSGPRSCPSCEPAVGLAALRLDHVTNPIGEPVLFPSIVPGGPTEVRLAAVGEGRFVLAWRDAVEFNTARIRTAGLAVQGTNVMLGGEGMAFNSDAVIVDLIPRAGYAELFWVQRWIPSLGIARVGPDGTPWEPRLGGPFTYEVALTPAGRILLFRGAEPSELTTPSILPPPPAAPAGVRAERSGSFIQLTWDPVAGAEVYRVERTGLWSFLPVGYSDRPAMWFRADPGEQYRVIAVNRGGESSPSAWVEVRIPSRRRAVER